MAFKSFLSAEDWQQAQELMTPPLMKPDGDIRQGFYFSNDNFSSWLGQTLEEKIKSYPEWRKTHPIALGSWAREELCPKSDIDMLFCGDEKAVRGLIDFLQEQGFKLRYRMPQDEADWTVNVQVFDILALLKARPWTPEAAQKLHDQQKKIWARKKQLRRDILKVVKEERQSRAQRFDSITNYLEPHLKFGPGGLRDLEQGLQIYELFAEKFMHPGHALNILAYYRNFFLTIRQKLHLEGHGDILSSSVQFDLATWLGFSEHKDFMRELERGLSRVHFYTDWIVDVAGSFEKDLKATELIKLKNPQDLYRSLKKNPRLLIQKKVRESLDTVFTANPKGQSGKPSRLILEDILDVKSPDAVLVSVFRSRMIDKLVPEIQRLVGYVQHDQYHRFTADSHIMQACREVKRIYKKPSELSALQSFHKKLGPLDWKIISWTALYHDLAKGLGAGELHGEAGIEIVIRDFKKLGLPKTFENEVSWMVQNHLELSHAAFRKNPRDSHLWEELQAQGITGARLYRLAVFTAIDIRATNPEAWTDWKSKLLYDLCISLESKRAQDYFQFQKILKNKKIDFSRESLEELSPVIVESLGAVTIGRDLEVILKKTKFSPTVLQAKNGDRWVRFYTPEDRPGLLVDYVRVLHSLGLSISHAAIHTISGFGVYDWFQLSTRKDLKSLKLLLEKSESLTPKPLPQIEFDSIEIVSASPDEWVFLFKGPDQPGFLAVAAQMLASAGVNVRSARVHTWGRKVEDVFVLEPVPGKTPQEVLKQLS